MAVELIRLCKYTYTHLGEVLLYLFLVTCSLKTEILSEQVSSPTIVMFAGVTRKKNWAHIWKDCMLIMKWKILDKCFWVDLVSSV